MDGVLSVTRPYGAGLGQQLPLRGTAPAAGANFTLAIDGYAVYRLLSLIFLLTTDANAANRVPTIEYVGLDGFAFAATGPDASVTASSTQRCCADVGYTSNNYAANSDLFFCPPGPLLFPGDSLQIVVASVQAGDTLTRIRGTWERFPLNEDVLPILEP